jgi:8-oxo-dGTP pyrophosphatase MutT (NUDIX family)
VAVILLRPEEMLLCHRTPARLANPDVWDFPGGHVEPGENPLDALRREVAEELGAELEGVDGGPVLRRLDPRRSLDFTVWASRRWRGEVSNMQPHEHDAIGWFTAAQVEELKLADSSYLTVLRRLLSAQRRAHSNAGRGT